MPEPEKYYGDALPKIVETSGPDVGRTKDVEAAHADSPMKDFMWENRELVERLRAEGKIPPEGSDPVIEGPTLMAILSEKINQTGLINGISRQALRDYKHLRETGEDPDEDAKKEALAKLVDRAYRHAFAELGTVETFNSDAPDLIKAERLKRAREAVKDVKTD